MQVLTTPLVHVIVPLYNVEKYIHKCIDSILKQTYMNLRIILIDDGSTDASGQICDQYAQEDSRIYVIHKENGGQSTARNCGLSALFEGRLFEDRGEYITFIDADDYVTPDYISFLYELVIRNNADIAQCGFSNVFSGGRVEERDSNHCATILNKVETLECLCYDFPYYAGPCGKLYRSELLETIRFPEGQIYEDLAISYLVAEKADRVAIDMTSKYYYVQRSGSTMNGAFTERNYQLVSVGDEMADYITMHYPELTRAANAKRVFVRGLILSHMVSSHYYDQERVKDIRQVVKKLGPGVLRDTMYSKKDKLSLISTMIGFRFYRTMWLLYHRTINRRHPIA